jgi:hypothetical protein
VGASVVVLAALLLGCAVPNEAAPRLALADPGDTPTLADRPPEPEVPPPLPDPQRPPQEQPSLLPDLPPPPGRPEHPPRPPRPAPPPGSLAVGTPAVALEQITCEPGSGAWLLLIEGEIAEVADGSVALRARRRIGLRYWPTAEGVDETDWFCAPRRRFCYAAVRFGDWGGTIRPDDLVLREPELVFAADRRLPLGVVPIIRARCGP